VKERVERLRARLGELRDDQWVTAWTVMDEITSLLGHASGPSRGRIEPRVCRYCRRFGHTRQFCKLRQANDSAREDREARAILEEDRAYFAQIEANREVREPYDVHKTAQARFFDDYQIPYSISAHGLGALVGVRGETHHGKYTFDESGCVIFRPRH
jgi:hypothetical protein